MPYTKRLFFTCWLCVLFATAKTQPPSITPDGRFQEPAWQSARVLLTTDSIELRLLQSGGNIVLGIMLKGSLARYADVYIKSGAKLYNLHASFQAGERLLPDTGFTDDNPAWKWGNNKDWQANTVAYRPNANDKVPLRAQLLPYEGYEFIISKEKLSKGKYLLRIEVKGFEEGVPPVTYPIGSERYRQKTWKEIKI